MKFNVRTKGQQLHPFEAIPFCMKAAKDHVFLLGKDLLLPDVHVVVELSSGARIGHGSNETDAMLDADLQIIRTTFSRGFTAAVAHTIEKWGGKANPPLNLPHPPPPAFLTLTQAKDAWI